jgi:hypothetical protein
MIEHLTPISSLSKDGVNWSQNQYLNGHNYPQRGLICSVRCGGGEMQQGRWCRTSVAMRPAMRDLELAPPARNQ